ncbi:MAG: hypothetical protein ABJH45_07080 [Paracoccaceae bacterium]
MTTEQEQTTSDENAQSNTAVPTCWACGTGLKERQRYCTNCSNWQGKFRRKLNLSNTVLSLLVALIAVIGTTAERVAQVFRGDPEPSLYVFGELSNDWVQLDLKVENLNELDRVLPFVFYCEPFGAVATLDVGSFRFYNSSPTLIRGDKNVEITYIVDPKAQLPQGYSVSPETLSGLNCKGDLGGKDADFELNVVFNNEQSIRFNLDEN